MMMKRFDVVFPKSKCYILLEESLWLALTGQLNTSIVTKVGTLAYRHTHTHTINYIYWIIIGTIFNRFQFHTHTVVVVVGLGCDCKVSLVFPSSFFTHSLAVSSLPSSLRSRDWRVCVSKPPPLLIIIQIPYGILGQEREEEKEEEKKKVFIVVRGRLGWGLERASERVWWISAPFGL